MPEDNVLREIQRETRERLDVLEVDRLNVDAKSAREGAVVGDASRVEFSERDWRKRRPETLDEIKRIVDAMGTPREERLKVGERVFLPPAEQLPPTRALTDIERKAIEAHLGGRVLRASIIYRSSRGHVVEVEHEREGKQKETTLLSVLGERVRDMGDIRSRVDAFDPKGSREEVAPTPASAPPALEPATAAEPIPETSTAPGEAAALTPVDVQPPAESEPAAPEPKKRFGLPKMGGKKKPEAPPEPSAADPAGEKKRFAMPKFGKRKDVAAAEPEPAPPQAADAEAPKPEGKGMSRFLKRKKDA